MGAICVSDFNGWILVFFMFINNIRDRKLQIMPMRDMKCI